MGSEVPGRILPAGEGRVEALAGAVDPRYRALVLLLRHTGIRWPEAVALRRRHCFLEQGSLEVAERGVEVGGEVRFRRLSPREYGWASVRDGVREALSEHLDRYVGDGRSALVFTDEAGVPLLRRRFEEGVWFPALRALGLPTE